ncbi:chromosome segregation protein SMC [Aliidiomarina sp. Khilg15.8]
MRLKYIKLVGFKSFVDATKVPFPEQMTCVVGPNGCGKSNVIDAVRWVLGESSARNLRGDAMTDVIFNGSSARKPVSQASVELVFDNSSGRLQGEFASYQEVSVKRVVTREAQSTYLLNNTKCRRRDITDLFLGTGLGPRSYAIIEQGMISRLIESRPQELRVFIEEAAGISKYKERRKDTENRMMRTRDNLERLTDVREELTTQLQKLQRQAAAARRYKELKAEERELKAQLQALKWLAYQQQYDRVEQQLQQQQTELERWVAEQRGSEHGQTQLRERQHALKADFDSAQQRFYQISNDITRLEQRIQHQRENAEQRRRELADGDYQRQQLREQLRDERAELDTVQNQLQQLRPQRELHAAQAEEAAEQAAQREEALQQWQDKTQAAQQERTELEQQQRVLGTEQAGIESLKQRLQQQAEQISAQLAQLNSDDSDASLRALQANLAEADEAHAEVDLKLQAVEQDLEALQADETEQQAVVSTLTDRLARVNGRAASLQQLIESADKPVGEALTQWLQQQPHVASLAEVLQVDSDWQLAAEQVAGPWLNSPVVLESAGSWPDMADSGRVLFAAVDAEPAAHTLAARMQGEGRRIGLFHEVGVASDPAAAKSLLQRQEVTWVVLPDGRQFSAWGLNSERKREENSQLVWQQKLAQVSDEQQALETKQKAAQQLVATHQQQIQTLKHERGELREQLQQLQHNRSELNAELSAMQKQREHTQQRREHLLAEQDEVAMAQEEQDERLLVLEESRNELEAKLQEQAPVQSDMQQQGDRLRDDVQSARNAYQQAIQTQHESQLQVQQLSQTEQHLRSTEQRTQDQLKRLEERLQGLAQQSDDTDTSELDEALALALAQRDEAEAEKTTHAEALAEVDEELGILTQGQQGVLSQIEKQREQVEASKMELAAARERGHTLLEGLQESGYALKEVLASMPEDASETPWQQRLDKVSRSLQQLGAINLAAIEEAEAQAERKSYLDSQYEDLQSSLALLDEAIRKIDKETRQRFRKTFDQVNSDLGRLFPKVFGGGSAYLALTEDDLLETGVTIMARPPGKKNSTIHLLSGGEKALTALSLVFAIFRLNPAPFCLLDEVDAPLDDANVGRFCRLVQEMSESVQFIYISHNKIAMEMATHLAGVTMQEPGVSRLVAVDVDEAVAMAEAP